MKKTGQKSKFDTLTEAQREQLISWLCEERISYALALSRLKEKFGLKSSSASLSLFWQRECGPRLIRREKLKGTFLEIRVRVLQGVTIVGETEFSVALNTSINAIAKDLKITAEAGD